MQLSQLKFSRPFVIAAAITMTLLAHRAQAQTENIIYSFAGGTDGADPSGGLALDARGNLYGVAENGGANGAGMVFELSRSSGGTWTKSVLYSFSYVGDVYLPTSNLVFDAKGNLYGIAPLGGAHGSGGIFSLSPSSDGTWTEKVIYSFAGGNDIVSFQSGLAIDSAGNLYGYRGSYYSSTGTEYYGAVFEVESNSDGTWTEEVLHTFSGGNDGSSPYVSGLTVDSSGNVYGMANNGRRDFGLVFELVRGANGSWHEKVLHAFEGGADGSSAAVRLLVDSSGNVFGASTWAIFELVPDSNGTWTEKILHNFGGGGDGAFPSAGVTMGRAGRLYGTTSAGGVHHGIVFELIPDSNGTWTERILHRFTTGSGDGFDPSASPLVVDLQGHVYGTTGLGGTDNNGVVFEITP